jgi:hypothetical protein
MPRISFGFPMLRDDLTRLAGFIEAGNETQAEILSELLMEDLRRAGSVPAAAHKGHRPTAFPGAGTCNAVAIFIHTCLVNINKGRLDRAAASVRSANEVFRASPLYPKDDPPSTPGGEGSVTSTPRDPS